MGFLVRYLFIHGFVIIIITFCKTELGWLPVYVFSTEIFRPDKIQKS